MAVFSCPNRHSVLDSLKDSLNGVCVPFNEMAIALQRLQTAKGRHFREILIIPAISNYSLVEVPETAKVWEEAVAAIEM